MMNAEINLGKSFNILRGTAPAPANPDITAELYGRVAAHPNFMEQSRAIQALAACMAERPAEVLPRFVALAQELTGATSAGLSLFEPNPAPGVFRWRWLEGALASFEDKLIPRDESPCGIALDRNAPILVAHPEHHYSWAAASGVVAPEVLLLPLHLSGDEPLGTLWVVAPRAEHFNREHARLLGELARFAGIALRMVRCEADLRERLAALERGGD
jgi:GAF domain-containing protein